MKNKNIKEFEIDLSECLRYISGEEDKIIAGTLRKYGLFNKNCLYSVFNGARKEQVKKEGNYRRNLESIFAFNKKELTWEKEPGEVNSIKDLSNQYEDIAIAIYDKKKFHQDFEKGDFRHEYFFDKPNKKPEALLGIASLKF